MVEHIVQKYCYAATRSRKGEVKAMGYDHWGQVVGKEFIPNARFLLLPREVQDKYIFREDWNLEKYHEMREARVTAGPTTFTEGEAVSLLYGHMWTLQKVAERQGLVQDLLSTFGDEEIVNQVLTVAYYVVAYPNALYELDTYQQICMFPTDTKMTSTKISALTASITYDTLVRFSRLRIERFKSEGAYAIDSSSISSYSQYRTDVMWGSNKKHEPLRQSNLLVVYSIKTHQPVFVLELPGNMPDGKSFFDLLEILKELGIILAVLITDRGYFSSAILEELTKADARAIMAVKTGANDAYENIKKVTFEADGVTPVGFNLSTKLQMYTKQIEVPYKIKLGDGGEKVADKLKLNLYYNPVQKVGRKFDRKLELQEEKEALDGLISGKTRVKLGERHDFERQFPHYDLIYKRGGYLKGYSEKTGRNGQADYTDGFRANMTIGLDKTPEEAMLDYAERDDQEKVFEMLGILGIDRYRTQGDMTTKGRLFIYFVAMILFSDLRECWRALSKKEKKKFPSTKSFLTVMQTIRYNKMPGKEASTTQFVGKQIDVCNYCGLTIPAGSEPDKALHRVSTKKRGRPRKNPN